MVGVAVACTGTHNRRQHDRESLAAICGLAGAPQVREDDPCVEHHLERDHLRVLGHEAEGLDGLDGVAGLLVRSSK